jgi:hypothetical protein
VGAPLGWDNMLVVGTFFVMREIELAYAKAAHVRLLPCELKVTLLLPVSKKDPRGVGCERSWTCLCASGETGRPDCPYHAVVRQIGILKTAFGDPLPDDLPLFPGTSGCHVDKRVVVAALECTVVAAGDPILCGKGGRLFGGHSFRVTGAQRLASLGVQVVMIMVLARWAGDTVLRYVKEAPLDNLPAEVLALEGKQSVVKLLSKMADGAENLDLKVLDLEQQVRELVSKKADMFSRWDALASVARSPPFVTNGAGKAATLKVHKVLLDGPDFPPLSWRTRCGFRFAFCGFTRHASIEHFEPASLCKVCCVGAVAARAAAPCISVSPSGSSSSSASSLSG